MLKQQATVAGDSDDVLQLLEKQKVRSIVLDAKAKLLCAARLMGMGDTGQVWGLASWTLALHPFNQQTFAALWVVSDQWLHAPGYTVEQEKEKGVREASDMSTA